MSGTRPSPVTGSPDRTKSMAPMFPSEAAAAAASTAATPSLAALLTRHMQRDGEIIILMIKPSLWFIPLTSLRFIATVALLVAAAVLYADYLPGRTPAYLEIGVFLVAGRITWAVLQWLGRLYILTDQRIMRLGGVFGVDIFDCPLRKVARSRILYTVRERLTGLGTIEIIPEDEQYPIGLWQMVRKPRVVQEQILTAIRRAKQCGRQ